MRKEEQKKGLEGLDINGCSQSIFLLCLMILAEETLLPCGAQAYWAFCSGKQKTKEMRPVKSDLSKRQKNFLSPLFPQWAHGGESPLEARWLVVLVQVTFECKRLVTPFTLVVLEGWVCLHVSAQVWPVGKCFATVRTPKRFLARVRAHVALQQPGPAERFAAHVALVLEVVGQKVHGHRRHWDVDFATRGALLGHLAVYAPVCLLVPAQVGGCGVGFAALAAGVPLSGSRVCCCSPPWPSVHYEKGINCVLLAYGGVPIDVATGRWGHLRTRAVRLVRITIDITMDTRVGVVDAAIDDWRMAWGGYFRDDGWVTSHDIIIRRWTQIITDVAWREREGTKSINWPWQGDWLEIRNWLVWKSLEESYLKNACLSMIHIFILMIFEC